MKKYLVLGILFILPILAYMFFASGVNNFGKLPVLTDAVEAPAAHPDIFEDKITVLGFFGQDLEMRKTNALNLNQKIYKRFNGFTDFSFVVIVPEGTEESVADLKAELSNLADVSNWNFISLPDEKISELFNSLRTPLSLDDQLGCDQVFIIDKESRLRGRDMDDTGFPLYGYNATSVAELNNKMVDDVKVILAEYRLALKTNANGQGSRRDALLKKNSDEK